MFAFCFLLPYPSHQLKRLIWLDIAEHEKGAPQRLPVRSQSQGRSSDNKDKQDSLKETGLDGRCFCH